MVSQKKLDIIFLQETHSDSNNEVDWGLWWRGYYTLSHGTNMSAGVATLIRPGLDIKVTSTSEIMAGRAVAVKAEIHGFIFCFINVYAPNQGPGRLDLFQKLSVFIKQCSQDEVLVMAGDWNCTTDFTLDRTGQEPHLQSAAALAQLGAEAGVVDVWRIKHPSVRQYTWVKVVDGRHWTRASVLYLPVQEGGQGLVDINSRVTAFRLQTVQRLLYSLGLPWTDTACLLLRKAGRLGYDKQLFLVQPLCVDIETGLAFFYLSVLQAWQTVTAKRRTGTTPGMWVFEEPLFGNTIITSQVLSSASLRVRLIEAGLVKLGHLLKTSVPQLADRLCIRSTRVLLRLVEEVCASLPAGLRAFAENRTLSDQWDDEFVGQWQSEEDDLLRLKNPESTDLETLGKKDLYLLSVKVLNLRSLAGVKVSRWTEFFGVGSSPRGCWRSLYKPPVNKRTGDLQWRIVHGAIATNRYLVHIDPNTGDGCPFCSQSKTVFHLFVQCPRLEALFRHLQGWFQGLGVHILQVMYSCEWDDEDDATDGYEQHGYDGEDYIALDLKTWEADSTKLIWNQDRAGIEHLKNYYTKKCVYWLKTYLAYGKSTLQRTVRHVSIRRRRHKIWKSVSAQIGIAVIHPAAGVLKYSDKVSRITLIQD
ncbi:Transposon TX1 uncharacterized protein [Merluccius polli]|uniref:Transposon TX1 uncharacterized protein n=1 Tax=Merluccius polli TaxID=89951 RepID=A0AA47MYH4_MERPO|nr:Transposon TX1 uncharacterized protein [Merluccius polli]